MTTEFNPALAASILDATLDLERTERELLGEMLRCAEWCEWVEGHLFVGFYDLKEDGQITTTQAWRKLNDIGLVDWTGCGDDFQIKYDKLMPKPIQEQTP